MKKILSIFLIAVLLIGCEGFKFEITSGPNKTTIKVHDAEDGAYIESEAIMIGKNKTIEVESQLDEGELKIEFASASSIASTDGPNEYLIDEVVESINIKADDKLQLTLQPGDYILLITSIGKSDGIVTLTISKKE